MRLSDLQSKDVISVSDGKKVGNIIDVIIDDGSLVSLVVERTKFFVSRFSTKNELEIAWKQVNKIGEDVILVNLNL